MDLDQGGLSLNAVDSLTDAAFGEAVWRLIYSTWSATEDKPRWRVIVPFFRPIASAAYPSIARQRFTMIELCGELEEIEGVVVDGKMADVQQASCLPAVSRAGAFYQFRVGGKKLHDVPADEEEQARQHGLKLVRDAVEMSEWARSSMRRRWRSIRTAGGSTGCGTK